MSTDSVVPAIGSAVLVTFFDGSHALSSVVAHVLGITGAAANLATPDGHPALTVAYPDPAADPAVLSRANWQKGYVRKASVVHFTHELATSGKESIVWGYPVVLSELPILIKPEAPATNPIFERPVDTEVPEVPLGLHDAVTLRSESEPEPVATTPGTPEVATGTETEPPAAA